MLPQSLTTDKPELLADGSDEAFRTLLYDFFAFGRNLDDARSKFAQFIGLSPTQYLVLIAVDRAPKADPLGINQIADKLHLSGAFVTTEVKRLVAQRLVEKVVHPVDGRRVQIVATNEGRSRLNRLAAFQRPVNGALFDSFSLEEFVSLAAFLSRLAINGEYALKLADHLEATLERNEAAPSRAEINSKRGIGATRKACG